MRKLVVAVIAAVMVVFLLGGKVVVDRLAPPTPLRGELKVVVLAPQADDTGTYHFEIRSTHGARCYAFQYQDVTAEAGVGLEEELTGGVMDRLLRRTLTWSVRGTYIFTPPEALRIEAGKTYPLRAGEPFVIADLDDGGFWRRWVVGIGEGPPAPN